MTGGIDPAANADALEAAIAEAAHGGAVVLFTPEMSGLLDRDRQRASRSIAAEPDDIVLARTRAAAARHGIWVAIGSLAVEQSEGEKWRNRSFVIDAGGDIVARYDKLHLFDVDLPTGESWRESSAYEAGRSGTLCATPAGMLGLSVCYDLRFPALYLTLSEYGAEILAIPSAFTVPTGEAHWHTLIRARAIENACWVVAAAQTGQHEDGRRTFGHSLVVDPWGVVVLDMGEGPGVGFAEIDLAAVAAARQRIPVLAHRRPIPHIAKI
jgi:deaminated glutathione amidase